MTVLGQETHRRCATGDHRKESVTSQDWTEFVLVDSVECGAPEHNSCISAVVYLRRLPGMISLLVRQRSAAIHQQVLAGDVRRTVCKIPNVFGNGGRVHNLTGCGAITIVLTHGAVHFFA